MCMCCFCDYFKKPFHVTPCFWGFHERRKDHFQTPQKQFFYKPNEMKLWQSVINILKFVKSNFWIAEIESICDFVFHFC